MPEKDQITQDIQARVLFTGRGVRMIENLMDHVAGKFIPDRCHVNETEFRQKLERFRPHVVVICLQNEFHEDRETYYALKENPEYRHLPVLILGRDEDCTLFHEKIRLNNEVVLERPLNMDVFLSTLRELTDRSIAHDEEIQRREEEKKVVKQEDVAAAAPAEVPVHQRKSILVVDDDVRMLNVIKLYLQDLYDVTVVPNGKLALKFLEKKHADMVLLDYLMPEMSGPQVLEQIRTGLRNPDVPVLFLTGVSDKDMVIQSLRFSPSGYLLKPVTRETLLERVTEILLDL